MNVGLYVQGKFTTAQIAGPEGPKPLRQGSADRFIDSTIDDSTRGAF